jgi:hypothetical protein
MGGGWLEAARHLDAGLLEQSLRYIRNDDSRRTAPVQLVHEARHSTTVARPPSPGALADLNGIGP